MADISLIQDESYHNSEDGGSSFANENSNHNISNVENENGNTSPCSKLEKYALSHHFHRQMVPSILLEIFRDASVDTLTSDLPALMDIVTGMADDVEAPVRIDLVHRIPHLATACVEFSARVPALSTVLEKYLLPIVIKYLGDVNNHVRKSANSTLLSLIKQCLLSQEVVEQIVCPQVLRYTYANNDTQSEAVTLMSKMVPFLGRETTEKLLLPRFSELCSSSLFCIRKVCVYCFGEFCAVISKEAYETLILPFYIKMCSDDTWIVRKACAEVIMLVSCAATLKLRHETLTPVFLNLLQDESRWVRLSAYQTLGPFISTFANPSIIGLGYNQAGELVFINPAGTEFRINDPSQRAAAELKLKILQADECFLNGITSEEMFNEFFTVIEDSSKPELNKTISDSIQECHNVETGNKAKETASETEIKTEVNDENDESSSTTTVSESNDDNNTSEEGEKEKEQDNMDTVNNSDLLTNALTELISEDKQPENENSQTSVQESEDLEKYNAYQFFYISPDLPLDPLETTSPTTNENQSDDKFLNHLQNMYFNDDTQILQNDSSKVKPNSPKTTNRLPLIEASPVKQNIVPQLLLDHYLAMTGPELVTAIDNDITYHCAYSYPAVLLTLGKENWHLLKSTCIKLAADMHYKVRKTMALCLHEIALIIGEEKASEDLLPVFIGILKDIDEVRIGVLKNLTSFLKLIGPEQRINYLPHLAMFLNTENEWDWRFREELANQLLLTIPLFPPSRIPTRYVLNLIQRLVQDKVFVVRQIALHLITELARHLANDQNLLSCLLLNLAESFAHSKRWGRRQAFAISCSLLLSKNALPPDQFATALMPHLLDLSWDPVPNVRLSVARTLSHDIITHPYFADENSEQYQPVNMALRRLQSDKDRDVRLCALPPATTQ